MIKSNWTFDLEKIYEETVLYQDVYLNEVIESSFFSNLKKQTEKLKKKTIKATKTFLSKFSDSFSAAKTDCLPSAFLRFFLADVLNNQNFFLTEADMDSDISVITTVSFCEIFENKILDNFDFSAATTAAGSNANNKSKNHCSAVNSNNHHAKSNNNNRIFEYEDEVVIDGVKEVQITKVEQFDKLIE